MKHHDHRRNALMGADPEADPRVARDLMVAAYAELAMSTRLEAAERGERAPAEARALAAGAMRQLMGPAWDKPTRADLMVVKKRLDVALAFDQAAPEVRCRHDEVCLQVVDRLREIERSGST